jgi:hypothetical protein
VILKKFEKRSKSLIFKMARSRVPSKPLLVYPRTYPVRGRGSLWKIVDFPKHIRMFPPSGPRCTSGPLLDLALPARSPKRNHLTIAFNYFCLFPSFFFLSTLFFKFIRYTRQNKTENSMLFFYDLVKHAIDAFRSSNEQ